MNDTAITEIVSALDPELRTCLELYSSGVMIMHPLVTAPVSSVECVSRANVQLRQRKKAVEEAEGKRDWAQVLGLHPWSRRPLAFLTYMGRMSDQEYWANLRWIFTDTESSDRVERVWLGLFRSERSGVDSLMNSDEHTRLKRLPDVCAVYHCYQGERRDQGTYGVSWTLSEQTAR